MFVLLVGESKHRPECFSFAFVPLLPSATRVSTGKYSSKATARKRYLPRVAKGVNGFQQLKKDIASGT